MGIHGRLGVPCPDMVILPPGFLRIDIFGGVFGNVLGGSSLVAAKKERPHDSGTFFSYWHYRVVSASTALVLSSSPGSS